MTTSHLTRAGFTGVLALACVGAAGLTTAAPAHAAAPDGTTAAHFLAGQFVAGGGHYSNYGYPDYGLTIDGVLALDAAQTGQQQAAKAAAYVQKHAAEYNTYDSDIYSASTAKLLVFAQAHGLPTTTFLTQLQSLEQADGQFKDKSSYADTSNTLGQAFGIMGYARAGKDTAGPVDFLLKQQCNDGGFRIIFTGGCTGDTDATSFAVEALVAAGGHDAAVTKAVNFIKSEQQPNGGIVEPAAQSAPNTNSTGLAAVAFALTGRTADAAKAQSFVRSLQFGCSAPEALQGAIAYDKQAFDAATAKGDKATPNDQERRATAQALFAFNQKSYAAVTAGGGDTAPALNCSSQSPTSTPTGPTSSPSDSSTATTAPTSSTTASTTASPTSSTTASSTASSTSSASGTAPASATSSTSGTSTAAGTSGPGTTSTAGDTSSTTGPAIITDGGSSGGNDGVLAAAGVLLAGAALAGAGLRRRMRADR